MLYITVGYQVFRSRNQIRSFSTMSKDNGDCTFSSNQTATTSTIEDNVARNADLNAERDALPQTPPHLISSRQLRLGRQTSAPRLMLHGVPEDGFYGTITTEVQVVHSTLPGADDMPAEPNNKALNTMVSFDKDVPETTEGKPMSGQHFYSVTSVSPERHSKRRRRRSGRSGVGRVRNVANKFAVADHIKRAYLRTSFLFALSVLVTWIPSSMNRIHSWLTGESPFEYHVATAAVLPLQGLWNAVIFFVTSKNALRRSWCKWRGLDPTGEQRRREDEEADARRSAAVREVRLEEDEEDSSGDELPADDVEGRAGSDVELRPMAGELDRSPSGSNR